MVVVIGAEVLPRVAIELNFISCHYNFVPYFFRSTTFTAAFIDGYAVSYQFGAWVFGNVFHLVEYFPVIIDCSAHWICVKKIDKI